MLHSDYGVCGMSLLTLACYCNVVTCNQVTILHWSLDINMCQCGCC